MTIPCKIEKMPNSDNFYKVVSLNEDQTYFKGTWRECAEYVNKIRLDIILKLNHEFEKVIMGDLMPN